MSIITLPTKRMRSVGDALAAQVLVRVRARREQEVGERVGDEPIDLLGHRAVEGAEARLDVGDADAELRRPTSVQAIVEFTSPTTTSQSGANACSTGSKRSITCAVCAAWLPGADLEVLVGRCISSSSKNTCDIASS